MTLTPRATPTDRAVPSLTAATDDLHRQVSLLLETRRQRFNRDTLSAAGTWVDSGRTEWVTVPSLWQQLHAELANSSTLTGGSGGRPGSKLPLNPAILDLVQAISGGVNDGLTKSGLSRRLRALPADQLATGLQPAVLGRHAPTDDGLGEPLVDPQHAGQLAERLAGIRATARERTNLARVLEDTPANLRQLAQAAVLTRDPEQVDHLAGLVHRWVTLAETTLVMEEEGTETRGLREFPCPDCRTVWVTRDQDGDEVREPAVVAVFREHLVRHFTCRRCGGLWWRGTDIDTLTRSADSWRNPVPTHHVTFMIEREHIAGSFTCTAPIGADCRLICPEGCEAFPCGHKLIDAGQCNMLSWLSLNEPAESYAGDPEPLRSGPIDVSWDGADMTWEYAEPAVVVQLAVEDPSVQTAREAASA